MSTVVTVDPQMQTQSGYNPLRHEIIQWLMDNLVKGEWEWEVYSSGLDVIFDNPEDAVQFKLYWSEYFAPAIAA